MKAICFLLVFALTFCAAPLWAADDAATADGAGQPGQDLDATLAQIIRLLEASEYKTFIATYAHPDDLKKLQEEKSLDEVAKTFSKEKAEKVLTLFKALRGTKPELKDDGKTATFAIPEKVKETHHRPLVFALVGNRWYIRD